MIRKTKTSTTYGQAEKGNTTTNENICKMQSSNRILDEITAWNEKTDNLKQIFGNHIADYHYLIRAKLECFKEIKSRYKTPANQDEKIARKILLVEIRHLEKIAFPNRIERFIRKTIENAGVIFEKILRNGRSNKQVEMDNEIGSRRKPVDISSGEKSLNKTNIQYTQKLKAVKDDTLLPKLRNGNTKGLKM